jgi:transposase
MARDERELTDAQWAMLGPLLPPQRPATGRRNKDHRLVLEAIVWLDRTGAPWRDLPACYGPWQTVASRFTAGAAEACSTICWPRCTDWRMRVGSCGGWRTLWTAAWSAPTSTPPAPATSPPSRTAKGIAHLQNEALGTSRGGLSTKLHLRVEGGGKPLVILATPGQRHEVTLARPAAGRGRGQAQGS